DACTLLVRAGGAAYFAGAFGEQIQLGWFGTCRSDLAQGPVAPSAAAGAMPFRVEVVDATDCGISAFRFVFDRPLDDPDYRIFVMTPLQSAQLLRFDQSSSNGPPSHAPGFARRMDRLRRMG